MKPIRSLHDLPAEYRRGAVAIGNFDGVHRGHAQIAARLRRLADTLSGPAIVFTFDPHPVRLLRPEQTPPPLTWTERKAELFAGLGIDALIAYPTDAELLRLTPQEFFQRIVIDHLQARALVEGPNFCFGRNREGNIETLAELCAMNNVQLEIAEPLVLEGVMVSSSRVRGLIAAGEVAAAARLLTEPYRIRGMVTHGAGRGNTIGFPTANVEAIDTLLPALGVYAARAILPANGGGRQAIWAAAVNVGPNPTFGEHALKVEAHLIDFNEAIYGQPIEIEFLAHLRGTRPFGSVDELKTQLHADVAQAAAIVRDWPRVSDK